MAFPDKCLRATGRLARDVAREIFWRPRHETLEQFQVCLEYTLGDFVKQGMKQRELVIRSLDALTMDVRESLSDPEAKLYENDEYVGRATQVLGWIEKAFSPKSRERFTEEDVIAHELRLHMNSLVDYAQPEEGHPKQDDFAIGRRERFIGWVKRHRQGIRGVVGGVLIMPLFYYISKYSLGFQSETGWYYPDVFDEMAKQPAYCESSERIKKALYWCVWKLDTWRYETGISRTFQYISLSVGVLTGGAIHRWGRLPRDPNRIQDRFDLNANLHQVENDDLASRFVKLFNKGNVGK